MNFPTLIVGLLMLSVFPTHADEAVPATKARLRNIRAFIAAAPKATTSSDLSYAIKIPEKERREAIERCNEVIASDKKSVDASRLRYELMSGEGRNEAVASFHNIDGQKEENRISTILSANLIACGSSGSRYWSVDVSQSHAARARRLLAEIIIAENLQITLTKLTEGGTRWVAVSPAEALKESP